MKKTTIIIPIIILIVLFILGYGVYRVLYGPSVSIKDKREIKKYVENYLTKKYGNHKFRVTSIEYDYHMTTLFDYSDPEGYFVNFKSDAVSNSWLTINGISNYEIRHDYFIEDYYFPEYDTIEISKILQNKLARRLLNDLEDEFDSNIYRLHCDSCYLNIPKDYGKIPTLEEIENNITLYEKIEFEYNVLKIEDTNEYEKRLKSYIKNKYNFKCNINFYSNDTEVKVYLTR